MLKKVALVTTCLLVISMSATTTQASPAFIVRSLIKQAAKQASKATGKKILDDGAERKCLLWDRFVCAKVAR